MKAMVLEKLGRVGKAKLRLKDIPMPKLKNGEVLVRVKACGVCRTDLDVIEGRWKKKKLPVVLGHQVVGTVESVGRGVKKIKIGDRVGITWIHSTCGRCMYCKIGMENLCSNIQYTGYTTNGGFAEYTCVSERFAFKVPRGISDVQAAPLFCAGIIGYRGLKLSGITPGGTLALFGFGASAHILIQIAKYMKCKVLVFTGGASHKALARRMGADWVGGYSELPNAQADAAIVTAPSGELVVKALNVIRRGATVTIINAYMSPVPEFDYNKYLYWERAIRSVANYTRQDAKELLELAAKIPIKTHIQKFGLKEGIKALTLLNRRKIDGEAVIEL